jgi:hypothetical protein
MVEDTSENSLKCICKSCPSKDECMNNNKEWLYCARGGSKCSVAQKGCLCRGCPITAQFRLEGGYYCIKGKAK